MKRRLTPLRRSQIGGVRHDPAVRLRGDGLCRRLAIVGAAAGDHHIRAVAGQPRGDGKPDPPRSA